MVNGFNTAPGQPLTAGQKAAATRRARQAAGLPPKTAPRANRPRRGGPAFATPKPTYHGLKLVALAAIEDVFVVKLRDGGITPDARKAWDQYQKVKALALGPVTNSAMQTEADSALRMAIVNLAKQAF